MLTRSTPAHVRMAFLASGTSIYVNGVLDKSLNNTLGSVGAITIGALNSGGSFGYGFGSIDDLAFFNTDRSDATVPSAAIAGGTAGLLGVYALDSNGAGVK